MKFKHGTRRRALEYEKDWAQRWKKDGTFKKSVENRPKDDSYVFYDGPPFITGVPHHGTLLSSIVKDAVPRYWTMKGKRVERRWGWDCHGLPAENFVEKQLGIVDRRQIVVGKNSAKDSLKFKPELAELIKRGKKTTTFRYHAKNLKVGDTAELFIRHDASSVDRFGYARITNVTQMPLRDLPLNEYNSKEEQLASYRGYWGKEVALDSMFTVYDFEYLGESLVQAPLDKDGNELPTISLETYIEKARESMVANSATWEGVIDRIGRWVDFKGAYRTMDKDFMESVWWAFKNLYDAGKIYEGEKVLMYDTKFATPVSKAEVTMDNDAYQTVTDPSVFVKFRVKDDLETDFSDCDVVVVKAGVKKGDKVLWVQEKKETAKHLWNMPGGKVEDGEDLETALRREIDEELGLGIKSLRMTKIHRFEDEHGKIAIILYETELLDGEIELEDKLENYGWFSLEEIEKMFASGEVRGRVEVDQAREILEPSHDKKVLFVCHGCVGRSQMAKALYNHYTQTTNAMAAGTDVAHLNPNASTVRAWEIENNRKSSANELMEDLGLSILDSERHQLTPEMLAEYDLVVNTATKAQTPEWFGGSNIVWWNMKDPGFSHTKDEIKAVRDEIDYRVKELIGGHIIDDTSKGLRELSLNDGEKELEFLRQMPQEENGFGRPAKPEDLVDMGSFRQFLSERVARSRGENIAPGRVPDTTYWVVRGDEIVGMVNIRHYLNDALIANAGGHIGIGGVPTKYRGQGIGSDALGMAVQKLHETGTKDILVGAFEDNIASRRMIEKNGGQLEKVVTSPEHPDRKMAVYWIRERSNSPYILAWTTTPWTLPANLMLAVNPEMTYCEVLVGGEKLIIAEEALERVLKDEKNKPLEYEVLRTFPGSELVGKSYEPLNTGSTWPTDEKTRGKIHKVYAADFVSHESGTGIVHVAPAYGEDDFELAKSMGVAPFHVIDDNGYYTDTNYKGLEVWDNNKFIAKDLKEKGIVWKIEYIRHEYPFNPRSKQRIMYRAIPSWFFDIQGSKPLMLEQNENINWFPPHLKHGRFAKNIEQAPDWNLSRDRFWATAMPVWKGDKGTVKVIGSYAELKELSGVELGDYHRPWVDDIEFDLPYVANQDDDVQIEKLDVFDENGNLTGEVKDRRLIHHDGDWHKAVHIWIINDKDQILLQRRVAWKDSNPNMLDISSAGHVIAGDSSLSAAIRELQEELGLKIKPEDLQFVKRIKKQSKYTPTFINNEFDDMFILKTEKTVSEMKIQKEEVAEVFFVSFEKFREMVEKKDPELLQHTEEFEILFDYFDGKEIPHEELDNEKSGETEHFTRIDKVLDGWFESGSMPFAQMHYPFENREKFEENYPADFIVEYVGQVRAWFYYVHAVNTELAALGAFGKDSDRPEKNAFKNVITTGVIAGNDGRKMSKSLGNFTDPNVLMDKFSADSLRFLLLSSPLLNGEDFALHDKDVGDVARKLSMVWNMYDFFTMYAEVDGWEFDPKKPFTLNPDNLTNPLDKWIVSRLHQLNEEVTRNMDGYNIPDALSPILPFLDDASNWYVRRSRRRFWKSEDDGDKNDAYRTLHYVLLKLSVILAPFTPFLAEELYQQLGGGNESVHLLDWPTNYTVDEKVVSDMTRTRELINTGLGLRMKKDEHQDSIKVRQPLQFASYAGEKLDDYYEQIMIEELNVKEIHHIDNLNEHVENYDEVHGVIDPEAWLEISKKITPELKREGLMREVIRFVQSARKNAGLNVDDRINLTLTTTDKELTEAIAEHHDTIHAETLAVGGRSTGAAVETVKIDGKELEISLEKAV